MNVWYLMCIFFFVYCVSWSIDERYGVTYVVDKNETEKIEPNFNLVCFKIEKFGFEENDTMKNGVRLEELKKKFDTYLPKLKLEIERKKDYEEEMFKKSDQIVFLDQLCFKTTKWDQFKEYFIHAFMDSTVYVFNFQTFEYVAIHENGVDLDLDQLIILEKKYPYSNCTNNNKNYTRFQCLNQCFKKANKLLKYFYESNETGLVHLKSEKNSSLIKNDEQACLEQCKKEDCLRSFFFEHKTELKNMMFKAKILISNLDFGINIAVLICILINISFYQVCSMFFKAIALKMQNIKSFKKKLEKCIKYLRRFKYFKWINSFATLTISLILASYLFCILVKTYNEDEIVEKEIFVYSIELEPVIVVCVPVLLKDYFRKGFIDVRKEINYVNNKSLLQLEKLSYDILNDTLDGIYLEFKNQKQHVDWFIDSKILFKRIYDGFSRCFRITVLPYEKRYQQQFLDSYIIFEFKHDWYDLFLLSKDEPFTAKSSKIHKYGNLKIKKKKYIRLKSNKCVNYKKTRSNCATKFSCIDHCIQTEFYKVLKNVSPWSIIDKESLKDKWSDIYLDYNPYFFLKINDTCYDLNKLDDCEKILFEIDRTQQLNSDVEKIYKKNRLDLYYNVSYYIEDTSSVYKLLLDLLNVASILFGINLKGLLTMIYCLLGSNFKVKIKKIYPHFVTLLCFIGFLTHLYFIFAKIVSNDLTMSQYYNTMDSYVMTNNVFCIKMDANHGDENRRLSGNYLEEINQNLKADFFFKTIKYFNEVNEWIELNRTTNFTNGQFKIDAFYLIDQKCFELVLDMEYQRRNFLFKRDFVLGIAFNETFTIQHPNVSYLTRIKNTHRFSRTIDLKLFDKKTNEKQIQFINQELFHMIYYDKFSFIKNPLSLFHDFSLKDIDKYMENLIIDFEKNLGLMTLLLPLKAKDFDRTIDDELFTQFYNQRKNVTDHSNLSNYERLIAFNHLKRERNLKKYSDPYFEFSFVFFKKIFKISNEDYSYSKLILDTLNALAFYLNVEVLDLHSYFCKLIDPIHLSFNLFLKVKNSLYHALH